MKKMVAVLIFGALSAWSQTTSALIFGTISDSSNAVLPGVTVRAVKTDTQIATTAVSNADGNYVFPGLAPGAYSVSCEQQGDRKSVV